MPDPSNVSSATSTSQLRDSAASAAQDVKERVSSTLGGVADKARQATADASGAVSALTDEAIGRIGQASDYVRDIDPKDVWSEVLKFVKSRPTECLAVAAVFGFIVGRGARRM